jgi:hypothetical protein
MRKLALTSATTALVEFGNGKGRMTLQVLSLVARGNRA